MALCPATRAHLSPSHASAGCSVRRPAPQRCLGQAQLAHRCWLPPQLLGARHGQHSRRRHATAVRAADTQAEQEKEVAEAAAAQGVDMPDVESDQARKKAEADRLRKAEKYFEVGTGEAECISCGYTYSPAKGDPEYPVSPGVSYQQLPADWQCPVCGANKRTFQSRSKVIAGFAENQGYGLGGNSMTEGQKSALIFGSLLFFFFLFLAGYFIQ